MSATKTNCRICGVEMTVAGYDDWELDDLLCIKCSTDVMHTITSDEMNAIIKKIKDERGDVDD